MKIYNIFAIMILLSIFCTIQVSGARPDFTISNAGQVIIDPLIYETIKQSNTFTFHVHAYNGTTGLNLSNSTTKCEFHLYNSSGNHLLRSNMAWDNIAEWETVIDGNNFTNTGAYAIEVWCYNGNVVAGSERVYFEVTADGNGISTAQGIVYVVMFILLMGVFIFGAYIFAETPFNNKLNSYGEIIGVDWKKYVKIGSLALAYVTSIGLSYLAWAVSYGILGFTEMSMLFMVIFRLLMIGLYLATPVIFIFVLVNLVKDWNLYKDIQRGFNYR